MSAREVATVLVVNTSGDMFYAGTWANCDEARDAAEAMEGDAVQEHVEYADSFLFGTITDAVVRSGELR